MAEITVTSPTDSTATAAMAVGQQTPVTTPGTDGAGVHVDNAAVSTGVAEEVAPDLLHTPFNNAVTIMGYPDIVINQTYRTMGHRSIKAVKFDHFSVDQRKSVDAVSQQVTITPPSGKKVFKTQKIVNVKVDNVGLFHESDQITFKGIPGYDKNGESHPFYYLNGYVSKVTRSGDAASIDVIILNGNPAEAEAVSTITIPANTQIIILGHALAEEDAHVPPSSKLPEPSEQYMQKFMTMASVTNVFLESETNVKWGLDDIKKGVVREFLLEVEKTFLFGHKDYFLDPETNKMIRTTGGFLEQLFEEGVEAIEIWKDELTDESIIGTMSPIFVGNRGSERRYMLTGMNFAIALFSLKSMMKQVSTNATVRQFTYDWNQWKLFNYVILNKPYALFDMLGLGNWALVYDKANIEYCVFRAMDEDMLDLDKLMLEDTKVLRCCEISALVVKYAKCHRLLVMHDGDRTTNSKENGYPLDDLWVFPAA